MTVARLNVVGLVGRTWRETAMQGHTGLKQRTGCMRSRERGD